MPSSRLRIFHRHRATHNSSPTPKSSLPPGRQIPHHQPMPLPPAERLGIPPFSEMPLPHHPAFALTAREPKRNPKAHRPGHTSPEPVRPTKTRLAAAGRRRHQAGPRAAGGPRLGGCAFITTRCLFHSKPRALTQLKKPPKTNLTRNRLGTNPVPKSHPMSPHVRLIHNPPGTNRKRKPPKNKTRLPPKE